MGLLVLTAALIPLPVVASEATPAQTTPTAAVRTSLHQAVAREAARAAVKTPMAAATERRADQGGSKGTMGFLKSRPGMIAVTVMAIGTGYAIYSAQHDRIKSPGRK